ncbi:MAG: hypothetical protein ACYDCQ_09505 [Dehalococcoidia bacterium]
MPVAVALSDVRDFVIVIWGIVSILLVLIRLAMVGGILWFGRKGMRFLHRQTRERAQPALSKALQFSQNVRDRTARLPGAPGSTGGAAELVEVVRDVREMDPPFKRKTRSWRPF